jgi:hypothetical protein
VPYIVYIWPDASALSAAEILDELSATFPTCRVLGD